MNTTTSFVRIALAAGSALLAGHLATAESEIQRWVDSKKG
jgi:hypothetical protein